MEKLSPYRVVAKEALMSWNGMSEEEATKSSYDTYSRRT